MSEQIDYSGPGQMPELTPEQAEQMRQVEEEMRQVRIEDLLAQMTVSLINLTARRIAKPDEQDLAQAKTGIAAVKAVVDLLDPEPAQEIKAALAQLQMMFVQQSGGAAAGPGPAAAPASAPAPATPAPAPPPASPPNSGLWVPGR